VIRSVFAIHDKQAGEFAFPLHMSISSFTHSVSSFSQVLDQLSNSVAHRESPFSVQTRWCDRPPDGCQGTCGC
jgi:hypothetical protein